VLWDGRALVAYTVYQDCTAYGAPGRCGSSQIGVPQPVAPQTLTVTIDYLTQAPQALGPRELQLVGGRLHLPGDTRFQRRTQA